MYGAIIVGTVELGGLQPSTKSPYFVKGGKPIGGIIIKENNTSDVTL